MVIPAVAFTAAVASSPVVVLVVEAFDPEEVVEASIVQVHLACSSTACCCFGTPFSDPGCCIAFGCCNLIHLGCHGFGSYLFD